VLGYAPLLCWFLAHDDAKLRVSFLNNLPIYTLF
jgi:hypothetical protein